MDLWVVVVGGIVVLAMVALSAWGAATLPPGSLVPLHHGIGSWNNWQPKKLALIAWPAIGVLIYALLLTVTSSVHSRGGKTAPAVLAPVALLILAFAYYNAIRAALRENGRD